MNDLPRILLVEDSKLDAELALRALAGSHLANEVLHLSDGVQALDYHNRSTQALTVGRPASHLIHEHRGPATSITVTFKATS